MAIANNGIVGTNIIDSGMRLSRITSVCEAKVKRMKAAKEKNPPVYQAWFIEPWEAGKDRISLGAPCVIMAYGKKD